MIIKLALASALVLVILSSVESNRRRSHGSNEEESSSSSSASASSSREFGRKRGDMERRRHHDREFGPQRRGNWGWRKHFLMNRKSQEAGPFRHHGKNGRKHGQKHGRHSKKHNKRHGKKNGRKCNRCPKFQKWEESTCLWPGSGKPQIPESCHANFTSKLPAPVAAYYKEKAREAAEVIQTLFKERGLTKACGFCSRKIACRQRKQKEHHSKKGRGCRPVEFAFVNEDCDDNNACEISVVNGGCPAPIPQGKIIKHNKFIARKFKKSRKHRSHGPLEFHGHRFGFEQARHKWHNEDNENSQETSSEETSAEKSTSASAESTTTAPTSGESSNSASAESSSVESSSSVEASSSTENDTSASAESSSESSSNATSAESSTSGLRFRRHAIHHARHQNKNKKKRYTPFIPLWHCVKNKNGDKCLCCCGSYFPDANTGKCVAVKHGNRFPPAIVGFGKP